MLNVQFQHSIVQSSHIHTEQFLVRSNVTFNNVMLAQACRLAKAFEIVYGDDGWRRCQLCNSFSHVKHINMLLAAY